MFIAEYGDTIDEKTASDFIDTYLGAQNVTIEQYIEQYATDWSTIENEYHRRAETLFKAQVPHELTAYLTVNTRNPYSIEEDLFFVTVPSVSVRKTIMHELWHFYTWYGLGAEEESRLGKIKYGDLKEVLTVLLNVTCPDLLPAGVVDAGYPQHQALRAHILDCWSKEQDIHSLWTSLTTLQHNNLHT